MSIPDNYDQFVIRERDQQRYLDSLPVCRLCDDPIQQERAVCINGVWYCDECLELHRVGVDT